MQMQRPTEKTLDEKCRETRPPIYSIQGFVLYERLSAKHVENPDQILFKLATRENDWVVIYPRLGQCQVEAAKLLREGWEAQDMYIVSVYKDVVGRVIMKDTMTLTELKTATRNTQGDFREALG